MTWKDADNNSNEFTYVISQPPALSDFRLGYTWKHGPIHPEYVLTSNDFQYEDHTEDSKWPGKTFQLYKPVHDVTPALYLGFDKELPVDRVGGTVERRGGLCVPGAAGYQCQTEVRVGDQQLITVAVRDRQRLFEHLPGIRVGVVEV